MIDVMDDDQLKEYLKNRPDDLKTVKTKAAPSKRVGSYFHIYLLKELNVHLLQALLFYFYI